MSDVALASIISTILATAATLITAWLRSRGELSAHPERFVVNAKTLVDTSGEVVLRLDKEIDRLEADVERARIQARDAQRQAEDCALEVRRLHAFLRSKGFDPAALPDY